ncbi:MAG: bacteriohemerythrin [Candidatus Marinimicrobia bacterium]|nr:bacteriohemerythrin [Candidatus Neomarinimicrobiota bacterium]
MSLIQWSEALSVNVDQFDHQHKKLVGMINRMHDAMSAGQGNAEVKGILNELVNYTKYHFKTEEDLMLKHGYPDMEKHVAQHENLTNQVVKYVERFENGERISLDFMKFLTEWLTNHIKGSDQSYSSFFNNKGEA